MFRCISFFLVAPILWMMLAEDATRSPRRILEDIYGFAYFVEGGVAAFRLAYFDARPRAGIQAVYDGRCTRDEAAAVLRRSSERCSSPLVLSAPVKTFLSLPAFR